MGPTIESRFNNNGTPNGVAGTHAFGVGGAQRSMPDNRGKWLIVTAISTALLLIVVVILLVMILGREEKVCTYEDVMETVEKEDSPSENWKIYKDFMFDVQEDALRIYAEAMTNERLSEEGVDTIKQWSEKYVGKFGGEAIAEATKIEEIETFMASDESKVVWRLITETNEGCARFDFSTDFQFLERYSLTAGNCDEFRE